MLASILLMDTAMHSQAMAMKVCTVMLRARFTPMLAVMPLSSCWVLVSGCNVPASAYQSHTSIIIVTSHSEHMKIPSRKLREGSRVIISVQ